MINKLKRITVLNNFEEKKQQLHTEAKKMRAAISK